MANRNQLTLVGRIGAAFKEGKTQAGGTYIWFPLEVESKQTANSTENNQRQSIHIMCFRKPVIDYLKSVKAHSGCIVIIFGFISSFPDEVKGKAVRVNAVNANEIYVVQTRPYQ